LARLDNIYMLLVLKSFI